MPVYTTQTTGVFTGYTLENLRALTLKKLRVRDTSRYCSDSAADNYDWIDDALNRGQDAFVRQTKCLRSYAIVELLANHRTYRLPEDFLDLMAAYFYKSSLPNGYQELDICTIEDLNDDVSDWRNATGTPAKLYLDRNYGAGQLFGLYPIPDTDGDTTTFVSEYGSVVEWVCPLYTFNLDVGTIIRMTGADEWILPTDNGVTVDVTAEDGNMVIEYYRLPFEMGADNATTQRTEIPREYQESLAYYAASDLLSDNPEDSNEYKRSIDFLGKFNAEIKTYLDKKKKPLAGQKLQARPHVWGWQKNMSYYRAIP